MRIENEKNGGGVKKSGGGRCGFGREGLLLFDNYALEDVLDRLSQIYPADFVIRDASLAGTRCHASIKGETLSDIVHMLEIGVPMRCVQEKSDSTMRAKIYVYKE